MNLSSLYKRRWLMLLPIAIAIASILIGSYCTWLWTPPSLPKNIDDALALIQSSRYQRLPDYRKREYLSHTRDLLQSASDADRASVVATTRNNPILREAFRDLRHTTMMARVHAYARSEPGQRVAILDAMIDRMGTSRRPRSGHGRPDNASRRNGEADASSDHPDTHRMTRRQRAQERIKTHIEQGNPQRSALIGEFFRALRARREERGLDNR